MGQQALVVLHRQRGEKMILRGCVRREHDESSVSCSESKRFGAMAGLRGTCKARGEVVRRMYASAQSTDFAGKQSAHA